MKLELELEEEEFKSIKAACEKKGLDVMECLQSLLSGAVESFLEDAAFE